MAEWFRQKFATERFADNPMPEWKPRQVFQSWALIKPDGHILLDSQFETDADAWQIGLGWPREDEIEDAKKRGYRVVRVSVIAP